MLPERLFEDTNATPVLGIGDEHGGLLPHLAQRDAGREQAVERGEVARQSDVFSKNGAKQMTPDSIAYRLMSPSATSGA
jgi:hypothetical protein